MTFIICEAGVNHNGDLRTAEKLIVAANRIGADAVKFQLFDADKLGRPEIKHLQISQPDMHDLKLYAERQGIEFICTPFDIESLEFLVKIGVKRLKLASGCIMNESLLTAAAKTGLPILQSIGMATPEDIWQAKTILGQPIFLHCTSAYPCPAQEVNLRYLDVLIRNHGCAGYSDHTAGIIASMAAVARGAVVIEKHLTLDRTADGPDHKASIEPLSFRAMVTAIREIEVMLGDGIKRPQPSEEPSMRIWR